MKKQTWPLESAAQGAQDTLSGALLTYLQRYAYRAGGAMYRVADIPPPYLDEEGSYEKKDFTTGFSASWCIRVDKFLETCAKRYMILCGVSRFFCFAIQMNFAEKIFTPPNPNVRG
jgi:hypothetical protein